MLDNAPVRTLHFKGLTIEGYNDVKEGDVLEVYTVREVARTS